MADEFFSLSGDINEDRGSDLSQPGSANEPPAVVPPLPSGAPGGPEDASAKQMLLFQKKLLLLRQVLSDGLDRIETCMGKIRVPQEVPQRKQYTDIVEAVLAEAPSTGMTAEDIRRNPTCAAMKSRTLHGALEALIRKGVARRFGPGKRGRYVHKQFFPTRRRCK